MRNFKQELINEAKDYTPENGAEAFCSIMNFFNKGLYSHDPEMENYLDNNDNIMDLMNAFAQMKLAKDFE